VNDAVFFEEGCDSCHAGEFSTLVGSKEFERGACLIFNHYFPTFEDNENRRGLFVCKDVDPGKTRELICERENVLTISERSRLDFATEVAKDSKEKTRRRVNNIVERLTCLLAENAVGAVARRVFDADEAKTVCRCVCESFVH
jgi:hypothetical protein